MILQIMMCMILLYPLLVAIRVCKCAWTDDFGGSFFTGQLLRFLPKNVIKVLVVFLPILVLAIMAIIIIAEPM